MYALRKTYHLFATRLLRLQDAVGFEAPKILPGFKNSAGYSRLKKYSIFHVIFSENGMIFAERERERERELGYIFLFFFTYIIRHCVASGQCNGVFLFHIKYRCLWINSEKQHECKNITFKFNKVSNKQNI